MMENLTIKEWTYKAAGGVTSVAVSADGQKIVAGTLDKAILCLDHHGKHCWQWPVGNQVWRVDSSLDGKVVVAGTGSTRPWDMRKRGLYCFSGDGVPLWEHDLKASIWGLAVSGDGSTIVVGTSTKEVILFDDKGKELWRQVVPGLGWYAWVWNTALSADGNLIVAGAADKRIRLFDRAGNILVEHPAKGDVFTVSTASDGSVIAAADTTGTVYLFDGNGLLMWEEEISSGIWEVKLSSNGQRLLVGATKEDAHIRLYDMNRNLIWPRHVGGNASSVDFSANSHRIIVGTYQNDIYIIEEDGTILHKATAQQKVRDVAISANGETAVAVSEDGFVYGFNLSVPTDKLKSQPFTPLPDERSFGKLLRFYRRQSTDPDFGGMLTQERLAELLSYEHGAGEISYGTVNNWERDKVKISIAKRPRFIGLIRVLHNCGGISAAQEANTLLYVGGHRYLDEGEHFRIFGAD